MTEAPIRDAASIIVHRNVGGQPQVLMGQRGKAAVFMPNKYVFPGGAVDIEDTQIALASPVAQPCRTRLGLMSEPGKADALAAAAIRELWEETGLILGQPARDADHGNVPAQWRGFFKQGFAPDPSGLRYFFRAITPPGRPRRFDARFFLVSAGHVATDPDDFSRASDELSHLHWVGLEQARGLDLPFITEIVLAELAALITSNAAPDSVPFFKNDLEQSQFLRLA